MRPCLANVCTLDAPLEADVADYAAGQCRAIELWLGKVDSYLRSHEVDDLRRLLEEHGMKAPVASFQGGLLASQDERRRQAWELFDRRLEVCQRLGVRTLVVAADLDAPLAQQDLDRLSVSLAEAADRAARRERRLAFEFQASAVFCNNLQTAAAVVQEVGKENLGVCFDMFHFQVGPSMTEDLNCLTGENLFHVQICDVVGVARELATDADRVLPGDGDFDFEPLLARLRAIDYRGHVAIELMNHQIWRVPPLSFGEIAMTALRKLLGQAEG